MTKWLKLSLVLVCTCVMNAYALDTTKKNAQSLDHIAAIVNKTVITQSELNEAISRITMQLAAAHTPIPPSAILHKQVLDQLINRQLQLDLAQQAGIHVTEEEITQAIKTIAQKNRLAIDALYASVAEQGLSKKDYRKEIHDEIAINRIAQQAIGNKITVSPQEVNDFMRSSAWLSYNNKEYHLENILIALPENPSAKEIADAKARAEALLQKLRQGVNFHAIAATESTGNKALQSSDLGWRKLPEIPSAFASHVVTMKENEIAGPIQTSNGFHIIHVAGVRSVGIQGGQEEQRKHVQELLYQRKYEEALQTWITKLRSESYVNLHPEN